MHGSRLSARPGRVVRIAIASPIPAAIRIGQRRMGLRIENDQTVAVGPALIFGLAAELVAYQIGGLLAAMEGDMHPAAFASGTTRRYVDEAGLVRTVCGGVGQEFALIEFDQLAARRRCGRVEGIIDLF